jgi:hypothetical protein
VRGAPPRNRQRRLAPDGETLPVVNRDDLLVLEAQVLRAPVAVRDDDFAGARGESHARPGGELVDPGGPGRGACEVEAAVVRLRPQLFSDGR